MFFLCNLIIDFLPSIMMIVVAFYTCRKEESRAEVFSAKLVGVNNMIVLIEKIHSYHIGEIDLAKEMTENLRSMMPLAYLHCKIILLWHDVINNLDKRGLLLHPNANRRIKVLQQMKSK